MLAGLSCGGPKGDGPLQPGEVVKGQDKQKPASSYQDTLEISAPAAIFYEPDSLQLERMRELAEKTVSESIEHECHYLARNARFVLKRDFPWITIVEARHVRFLLFRKRNAQVEWIDLDKKNDPCGLFLFDGVQSPRLTDMSNIESELGFYFPSKQGPE
jgi:hypothetical protein